MKKAWCLLIVFLSTIAAHAQTNEKVYLVEVTELTQGKSNLIVSVEAYQSLQTEMTAKNKLLSKALELATKEWKENHPGSESLPTQTASQGKVKSINWFSDRAKAEHALNDLQSREEKEQKKKPSGAEKQIELLKKQLSDLNSASYSDTKQTRISSLESQIKMLEDEVARKKKKDAETAANLAAAREIFMSKLQELLAGDKAKAATPKADDHQDEDVTAPKSN